MIIDCLSFTWTTFLLIPLWTISECLAMLKYIWSCHIQPISQFFELILVLYLHVLKNGSLLRRYTYLSNDSCYSMSPEDGVEISFMDNNSHRNSKDLDHFEESSDNSLASTSAQIESNRMPSFSFEAQVKCLTFC